MFSSSLIFTVLCGGFGVWLLKEFLGYLGRRRLPPGPRGWPVVGNFLHNPPSGCKEWEHWYKLKARYGPISSLTTMGQTIIILNDSKVTLDLLEKRSAVHSSRPQTVITRDLTGWNRMLTLQGDANIVRSHRKYMAQFLGTEKATSGFSDNLDWQARRLLLRILTEPQKLFDHIRFHSGATILNLVYGYSVEPIKEDPLVRLAGLSNSQFSIAIEPGAWTIDFLPILKYLPEWVPGASIKRVAREWRRVLDELADKPFSFVLHQRQSGKHEQSFVSSQLDRLGPEISNSELLDLKWTAAGMYGGGADTTVAALEIFYLAVALYPDVQTKAQNEIDLVLGPEKLPTLEDRARLPYINAILLECLRWHPVGPVGVPHVSIEDDTYNGYHIPKGSVLLANIWALTHDADTYPNPTDFDPGRFLGHDNRCIEQDPRKYVFGFGRRICPGRYLADASMFLSIAKSLAVFNVVMDVGAGESSKPAADFLPGIISHPADYKLSITTRSASAETMIRSVEVDNSREQGDSQVFNLLRS